MFVCGRQNNSKSNRRFMNCVNCQGKFRSKKSRIPLPALRPRPDQEPAVPNTNRSTRQDHAEKRAQSHWTQFTRGYSSNVFYLVGLGRICRKM